MTKIYEPKVGHKVTANTRHGKTYSGKVVAVNQRATGAYYEVNLAQPRQPQQIKSFRASELARA